MRKIPQVSARSTPRVEVDRNACTECLSLSCIERCRSAILVRVDGLSWKNQAVLGDLVRTEATITRRSSRIIEGSGVAYVGDKIVAEATFLSFVIGKIPK